MAFWNKFPYTDFHELNLDWILQRIGLVDKARVDAEAAKDAAVTAQEGAEAAQTAAAASQAAAAASENAAESAADRTQDLYDNIGGTVAPQVTAWLEDNVEPVGSAVVVDKSLLVEGAAADAKATGDWFRAISTVPDNIMYGDLVNGYYLSPANEPYANALYCYTSEYLPVTPGSYICNKYIRFVTMYDDTKTVVTSAGISSEMNAFTPFTVPSGIAYIRPTFDTTAIAGYIVLNAGTTITDNTIQGIKTTKSVLFNDQMTGILGNGGYRQEIGSMEADGISTITAFPQAIKKNVALSFYANFASFDSVRIGCGYLGYVGGWVEVTTNNIVYHGYESGNDAVLGTTAHGLTIDQYISVKVVKNNAGQMEVSVNSIGGTFHTTFNYGYYYMYGAPFAHTSTSLTNAVLSAECPDLKKQIWLIGDSYFGVENTRVMGQLKNLGYFDNLLIDGRSGFDSANAYAELERLLVYGTPKVLVWYINMNDSTDAFKEYVKRVSVICNEKGIELVLNNAPSIPSVNNSAKTSWMNLIGRRYINSQRAVNSTSQGVWYAGYLSSDNIHPSELGAKALAMRILIDVPEIMQA